VLIVGMDGGAKTIPRAHGGKALPPRLAGAYLMTTAWMFDGSMESIRAAGS
jgi:hypothetical protein